MNFLASGRPSLGLLQHSLDRRNGSRDSCNHSTTSHYLLQTQPADYSSNTSHSEEASISEVNEDQEDEIVPVIESGENCQGLSHSSHQRMLASQSYLETSPSLRRTRNVVDNGEPHQSNTNAFSSPSSAMEYKSKVQRLIQRMEQQQAQLLREQDAKSLEFRRRMDRLVYGPMNRPQVETDGDDNNATMDRDDEQTAKRGNHKQGSQVTKTHVSNHQQQDGTNKTTSQCTEATRSISTSSWSVASNSREEEDDEEYKVGSHFRNNCFPATPIQPEVVHIPLNAIASTPPEHHRNNHDAATIASLQKRIESLELDKCALESENAALRSLRESYKKRFSVEQQQRNQLQDQVALLKSYLEDTQQRNQELRQEMQASKLAQRQKRNQYLAKEQEWKHKIERIKRDFDHLWTKQKTSQKDLKESNAVVDDLQAELAALRKQERKWGKEKSFLQGKVQYLQSNTKMFTATAPKGVEKDAAPSST